MADRDGMRMMVVVPAFAAGQQGHPPVVARFVAGGKAPRSPHMRGGVYQPGGVQTQSYAQEYAPHDAGPSAKCQQSQPNDDQGYVMVFAQPDLEAILGQIGSI